MTKITLDPTALAKLSNIGHQVELCDTSGRTLGYFVPVVTATQYADSPCPVSEEELDRRERQGGGRTLAEILADLERRK